MYLAGIRWQEICRGLLNKSGAIIHQNMHLKIIYVIFQYYMQHQNVIILLKMINIQNYYQKQIINIKIIQLFYMNWQMVI